MNKILVIALGAAVFSGAAIAQEGSESAAAERYEQLERAKSSFQETWVAPDADFTRFDKLFLWTAEFQYRDVGPAQRTRSTRMNTRQREFGISAADREKFEEIVSESFVKEIQRAKNFEITEEIDSRTIIMRGAVLDIISRVPPEMIGRNEIYLASIGEATLVLEMIDANTGEVLAVVAERRAMQQPGGQIDMTTMPTNNATIIAEVRRWARRAATRLRGELDKAIAAKK
jgi:hypothetical protein